MNPSLPARPPLLGSRPSSSGIYRAQENTEVIDFWIRGPPCSGISKPPMNIMKRQKDMTLKDELLRSVGAQYATGEERRNNSRKSEEMEPKQHHHTVVDVISDGSKVQCCEEQYSIGTWNVRSMNQDKLKVVKQEMARVNTDILGITELK